MRSKIVTAVLAVLATLLPASRATIILNEVHFNPNEEDGNYEFIELRSTTDGVESCQGLAIVMINNQGLDLNAGVAPAPPLNPGLIRGVWKLDGLATGTNGLLLLGSRYAGTPRGGPWADYLHAATATGSPPGMDDKEIGPNDGFTVLLVSGALAQEGADVDVDNDRALDWTEVVPPPAGLLTQPWAALVDSIGTRDQSTGGNFMPYTPPGANIHNFTGASSLGTRSPDTMARRSGFSTPGTASEWYGGKLAGLTPSSLAYRADRIFGPGQMLGAVTPGRPNLSTGLTATEFRINEVGLDPAGDNERFQYVEIINTHGQARSLRGYWLLVVETDPVNFPQLGIISERWDLKDMVTGDNGLLLLGDLFSHHYNPFHDLPSPLTEMGNPVSANNTQTLHPTAFATGDLRNNKALTMLLVRNFPSSALLDLDANNDGLTDLPLPWTVVDQVGFSHAAVPPGGAGKTYSQVDLRTMMPAGLPAPHNLSRKAGNLSISAAAWYGGTHPSAGPGFNVAFDPQPAVPAAGGAPYDPWFGGFRGAGTPGLPNLSGPVDPAAPPSPAGIRINEVMIDPTNSFQGVDQNNEYVELRSTTGSMAYLDGLWLLVADTGAVSIPVIKGFRLDGGMTGLNGMALMGDNYDSGVGGHPYAPADGTLTPFCMGFDPAFGGSDLPNNGVAVMIVRGPRTGGGQFLTLSADGSRITGALDPDGDGVLIPPAHLAEEVLDSVVISAVNPGPGYGWIPFPFRPHHVARYPDDLTPNSAAAWYGGEVSQAVALVPSLVYSGQSAGRFRGAGSPGRPNHAAAAGPVTVGSVVINEVHLDPPGTDGNQEFIEVLDTGFRSRSLNGYCLVMFDNSFTSGAAGEWSGTGEVTHFWPLDGMATGENGLLLLGNHYPEPGNANPWRHRIPPQTRTGDPPGRDGLDTSLGDSTLGEATDNRSVALLLVRGFHGRVGFDLDDRVGNQAGVLFSPGDGIFDSVAWTGGPEGGIHDSVVIRDLPGVNAVNWDGFPYGLALLNGTTPTPLPNAYHPDSFARFYGELTPNSSAAWYGGEVSTVPEGAEALFTRYLENTLLRPLFPSEFVGHVTPGQPNLARNATADHDGDGVPTFLELAFLSDPQNRASVPPPPAGGVVNVAGTNYATITFRRIQGGENRPDGSYVAGGYAFNLEKSTNLTAWQENNVSAVPYGAVIPGDDGISETVTLRDTTPLIPAVPRAFYRIRAGRDRNLLP